MSGVAAASREGCSVTTAPQKPQDAPVMDGGLPRSGPRPASPDLPNDSMALAMEGAEDCQELLDQVEQCGDFGWEQDSEALRLGRQEAKLTLSADSVRAYLKQIGKVALLSAQEEVELAKRIEAGLYAAERLRRAEEMAEKLSSALRRDLRWIVRDGQRANNHLVGPICASSSRWRSVTPVEVCHFWI
jgi:RNA polymerase primary sigma factor